MSLKTPETLDSLVEWIATVPSDQHVATQGRYCIVAGVDYTTATVEDGFIRKGLKSRKLNGFEATVVSGFSKAFPFGATAGQVKHWLECLIDAREHAKKLAGDPTYPTCPHCGQIMHYSRTQRKWVCDQCGAPAEDWG